MKPVIAEECQRTDQRRRAERIHGGHISAVPSLEAAREQLVLHITKPLAVIASDRSAVSPWLRRTPHFGRGFRFDRSDLFK